MNSKLTDKVQEVYINVYYHMLLVHLFEFLIYKSFIVLI